MRFTIRDLLWLTVVVALAVGWWVERTGLIFRLRHIDMAWQDQNGLEMNAFLRDFENDYGPSRSRSRWTPAVIPPKK